MAKEKNYNIPAVRKAIQLVELLCESQQPLGVSEISQRLDVNKNMIFRLIRTLGDIGWIVKSDDPTKYQMGLRAFHHTSKPISRMNLKAAAMAPMMELWREIGESVYLGVLDDDRVLYLEHLDGGRDVKIAGKVGGRYHLHAAAPGKVMLAHGGEPVLKRVMETGVPKFTKNTLTTKTKLRKEMKIILDQGYAVDNLEIADCILCFAVPIYDYQQQVIGTIGTTVLTVYYTKDQMIQKLGPEVMRAGEKISLAMGYKIP